MTVYMQMRRLLFGLALLLAARVAGAETFGGFSGVDRPYLVGQDRVCAPLEVKGGVAKGVPACDKATADAIAKLSIKPPIVQSGAKATFTASASGRTLTVANASGATVVTWNAPDPIGKVVDVYASQYEDRVAVAYTLRRLGKEVTDVVAFELVKTTGRDATTGPVQPAAPQPTAPHAATQAPPEDPAVTKAAVAARKAATAKAWQAVLRLDADHAEAHYRLAVLAAKRPADALAELDTLAKSHRSDAIEWLVEARFDPAFAALRADPKFRAAVGLDRKPATTYERVMGVGGQWEQTGTSCDKAEVKLVLQRDRSFKLRVKTVCEGQVYDSPFKGTWRVDGDHLVLVLPPAKGEAASAKDEAPCMIEKLRDEDSLHCTLGRDLDFVVLPTRR